MRFSGPSGVNSASPESAPGIINSIHRCVLLIGWSVVTLNPSFSVKIFKAASWSRTGMLTNLIPRIIVDLLVEGRSIAALECAAQSAIRCYTNSWYSDACARRLHYRRAPARSCRSRSPSRQFSGLSLARRRAGPPRRQRSNQLPGARRKHRHFKKFRPGGRKLAPPPEIALHYQGKRHRRPALHRAHSLETSRSPQIPAHALKHHGTTPRVPNRYILQVVPLGETRKSS